LSSISTSDFYFEYKERKDRQTPVFSLSVRAPEAASTFLISLACIKLARFYSLSFTKYSCPKVYFGRSYYWKNEYAANWNGDRKNTKRNG
jgi:hypothetical protein